MAQEELCLRLFRAADQEQVRKLFREGLDTGRELRDSERDLAHSSPFLSDQPTLPAGWHYARNSSKPNLISLTPSSALVSSHQRIYVQAHGLLRAGWYPS